MSVRSTLCQSALLYRAEVSASNRVSLANLSEIDLLTFFTENNQIVNFQRIKRKKKFRRAIDFIHFIWMGNPLKEQYKQNILKWKTKYSDKDVIIWVDEEALKYKDLIDFAQANNIKLIHLEKVFTAEYDFGLTELIRLEKDRLPPNWGSASDMYRYLIMYYFGGIYADTDLDVNSFVDSKMDFESHFLFATTKLKEGEEEDLGNDFLVTRNLKEDFWKYVIIHIKDHYFTPVVTPNYEKYCQVKFSRFKKTLLRTGPVFLLSRIKNYPFDSKKVNYVQCSRMKSALTWLVKLEDEQCTKLAKDRNIIERIVRNVFVILKETNALDLTRFDKIIEKIPILKRDDIILIIKSRLLSLGDQKIKHIFAKNLEEYEKIIYLIPKKNLRIKSHFREWKVAEKRENKQMAKELSKIIFPNNYFSKKALLEVFKKGPLFALPIINLAIKRGVVLTLDAQIEFFDKCPNALFDKYKSIFEKNFSQDSIRRFVDFIRILPPHLLVRKNLFGQNIMHIAVQLNDIDLIKVIKKVFYEKDSIVLYKLLLLDRDLNNERPIDYDIDEEMQKFLYKENNINILSRDIYR